MPDETPGRVAATLAGIRAEALGSIAYADDHACPDVANSCSAHHALLLLAAVEAALALAVEWKQIPFAVRASDECADELREAITAALTGTQLSEDGEHG